MAECPCGNGLTHHTEWGEICRICEYKIEHKEWDEPALRVVERAGKKVFRFIFIDGSEEFGIGKNVDEAFKSIGLGSDSMRVLDYYEVLTKKYLDSIYDSRSITGLSPSKNGNADLDDEDGL